jgi:exodeoxyribonuclease V gamma subunit
MPYDGTLINCIVSPMFVLYSSPKIENLLTDLSTVIKQTPLSSPFKKEVFLIQHPSMERWLSQQLASRFKVWGNYQFLAPGHFFKSLAQKIHSGLTDTDFDRDVMVWRLESLLRGDLDDSGLLPLKQYLTGDNVDLKRYQLAHKLTHIFDQYQLLRPDMLSAWQQNQLVLDNGIECWQQILWQRITVQLGHKNKASVWLDVIARLNSVEPGELAYHLPERIFLFGINQLSPLMLDFLQALARHCQVHFFLLNPWSNQFSQNSLSRRQQHPLLSSLGQQGREFQMLLAERGLCQQTIETVSSTAKPTSILQRLQQDILAVPQLVQPLPKDGSISIHACHSRMREVEVLRNLLLQVLEQDKSLELRDIVVMTPDIQHYAPFIAAVFNDIQHTIADRSALAANHAINALIDFLQISQGRFGWKTVVDLLERPIIYPGFDLTDSDLALIKHWLQDTCVRWGQSAQHKQALGLFACGENTWQALLDRLLMGYAVGDDNEFVAGVLPYKDIEGSSAQALGGLHDFLQLLFDASVQLKQAMPLSAWGDVLYVYAEQLLVAAEPVERQQLNALILELSTTLAGVHTQAVNLQVIIEWLQDQADRPLQGDAGSGFLRGQLMFCALQPMRTIPFKVIALLGMHEGAYPRLGQCPTFDLTVQHPRLGDGSLRGDDRYQFLEILLSTRQQLIITYVGQSIKHNNRIAPAIVVSELLDTLRDSYQLADVTVFHPLHAFSASYFKGRADLFSFSQADCETAIALSQPKVDAKRWWQGVLTAPENTVLELADMFRFFQHPQRYFMRRQLDVRLLGLAADPEEREAFALEKLEAYASLNQGIELALRGESVSVEKLQAQGHWLSGVMGQLEAESHEKIIADFVERINTLQLGEKLDDLPVDIIVGDYRLVGILGNYYERGSLFYRYAALKGKDFVCAVLHHLIINRIQPQTTYLLSSDEHIVLLPEHCQDSYLSVLIDSYQQGQQRPDAFFTEPALAFSQQASKSSANTGSQAFDKAVAQLAKALNQPYELEFKRLFSAETELAAILGEDFEQQCRAVLLPLWQATHCQ